MTLDLGPIKERAERARRPWSGDLLHNSFKSADDVPALVAEVEALRSLAKTLVRGVMLAEGDFDDAPPHRPPWLADAIIAAGLIP